MRNKVNVPVGQGCKPVTLSGGINKAFSMTVCNCHTNLHLSRCMGCGDLFHTDRPQTKTCSDKCRKRLSRMRHDKMFQTVMNFATGEQ